MKLAGNSQQWSLARWTTESRSNVSEDFARDLACFGMTPVACKKSKIQLISFSLPGTNLVFVANH